MTNTVANTILQQLGGSRFLVMTGAKNLIGSDDSLTMKIGSNAAGVTHVRITLTKFDTYRMEFLKVRGTKITTLFGTSDLVYAEDLRRIFTAHTGLDTSL